MKAKKLIIGLVAVLALLITIATALAAPSITTSSPSGSSVTVEESQNQVFSITVNNDDGSNLTYQWYVDGSPVGSPETNNTVGSHTSPYTFNSTVLGSHTVNVIVTGVSPALTDSWAVTVEDSAPTNSLSITKIEVNGKTNGDLTLSEINKIEVEVSNDYTEDIEDIEVIVRILDVDGTDLDENDEIDLIRNNDEETIEFEFDLSDEELDENEYTIEVEVEGKADDDTIHSDTESVTADVDRENDDIIILKADLDNPQVTCPAHTSLDVVIKNIGENDQDGAEIRVKNSALGIDLQRSNIDLDDYSGSDNDYDASFALNLEDAKQGTYTLDVTVYSEDNDLMDSEQVELQVVCNDAATDSSDDETSEEDKQYADKELAAELQKKIDEYKALQESQNAGNVREGSSYIVVLGVLVALLFFAAVLSATYLLLRKR